MVNYFERGVFMPEIIRHEINEGWAHSGVIEAGDFVFVGYCVGNIGQPVEAQVRGALDHLCKRLETVGLTLESVVQVDALFRDIWNIPVMEKVFRERFNGKYPVRKSIETNFAHIGGPEGLLFQLDAIAYKGVSH
jgi:enamine deaminase RidA (YjgF/YER057c/UK114 family)